MTLEYQLTSGGTISDWEDLPTDYNEFPVLSEGDVLLVRTKAYKRVVVFAPGYYRMAPNALNLHPDAKWYDTAPWDIYDVDPADMQVLSERDGKFYPAALTLAQIREGRARQRNDHYVNYGKVLCAYDRCWHFLERKSTLDNNALLWNVALASGWKLTWPETVEATDLYCPAKHNSMGVPLTDMSGIPYDA